MNTVMETKTDSVTLQLGHALELFEGVSTHAHSKNDLLMLNALKISASEGKLAAVATDRFRMIEGTIPAEGALSDSVISLADIKRINTLLKGEGKGMDTLPITISRTGDMVSISVRGNAVTVTVLGGNYPSTSEFLNNDSEPIQLTQIAFDPGLMADYAKIAGRGSKSPIGVRLVFQGEKKPIKVIFAANSKRKVDYKAVIMPMRWSD